MTDSPTPGFRAAYHGLQTVRVDREVYGRLVAAMPSPDDTPGCRPSRPWLRVGASDGARTLGQVIA